MEESRKIMLKVDGLRAYYKTRSGERIRAVDNISFNLMEGEILGIAGESGCGKSTLAMAMSGLFLPPLTYESGSVFLDGENIIGKKEEELRKKILGRNIPIYLRAP